MYKIIIDKTVDKFLNKHKGQSIIEQFEGAVEQIAMNPFLNNLDIKPLQGHKDTYRLRLGEYRFLYSIIQNEISIYFFDVGARGDVYKGY